MKNCILIIDIETTGFSTAKSKILEIGIASLNIITGKISAVYSKVVHERPINREDVENCWVIKNSSLTVDEVRFSPELKKEIPCIQQIISHFSLGATSFNRDFDFKFLESRGLVIKKQLPCLMKSSTNVCKIPNRNGWKGYKWPSVTEAIGYFFPEEIYEEAHRGAEDAKDEARIAYELIKLNKLEI